MDNATNDKHRDAEILNLFCKEAASELTPGGKIKNEGACIGNVGQGKERQSFLLQEN